MSNQVLEGLVKEKDYIFKKALFKLVKDTNMTINELLLLIYFLNQETLTFNLKAIKEITFLDERLIMEAFSSLNNKELIKMSVRDGADGKSGEVVDLSRVYQAMVSELHVNIKANTSDNIFSLFEKEFARTLSPMEYEIINAWLSSGINEDLIIAALKEATFNGVSNLRYIDKIIYEWGRKGFKNQADVNNYLNKKSIEETKVLFDYNWLDEEE